VGVRGRLAALGRNGALFGFVVGILVGVLVGALLAPSRKTTVATALPGSLGQGASGSGAGAASGASSHAAGRSTSRSAFARGGTATGGSQGSAAGPGSGAAAAPGSGGGAGAASGSPGTSPAPTAAGRTSTVVVPGVTSTSVTIGVAYLDLGPVAYLGPQYDIGNVPEQWQALVDGWRRQGLLPVHGRTIKLVFQSYSVLDPTQEEAACVALVQDDHAFAVVAPQFFYQYGDQCVTAQEHTPLITSDGAPDSTYAAGAPYLFTAMTSEDNLLRNFVYWARARGLLAGRRIGIYYLEDPEVDHLVRSVLIATLHKLGYGVAAEATTNSANGGPDDALAVEKFRAAGVNLAILLTSNLGFLEQAEAQDYHPTYIDSDWNGDTTYLGANDYPPSEYDGTYAVTEQRHGEWSAGIPPPPQDAPCLQNYERYSGQTVQPANETNGTWVYVMLSCDLGDMLLHGLEAAGRQLTPSSFVAGLETIRDLPMRMFPPVSFTPTQHDGVQEERTLQWHGDCRCWAAVGPFSPLPVPPSPSG
jgi:hypothetical protein